MDPLTTNNAIYRHSLTLSSTYIFTGNIISTQALKIKIKISRAWQTINHEDDIGNMGNNALVHLLNVMNISTFRIQL